MRTARAQQPPFKGVKAVWRVPLRALGLVLCRCQRRVIPGEGWGEEVVDYGGDFAGGGGVFGGAEDDPC
jgi:hypothetical protein